MATILHLRHANRLFKFDPELEPPAQQFRTIDLSPRFVDWAANVLPTLGSIWNIETQPLAQFDDFTANFCSGEPLTFDRQFHPIQHVAQGVWMLKTADLRLFGWFHQLDNFIAVCGDQAEHVKQHDLYYGYAGEVGRFRDGLDLDAPKFLPGGNPDDVVSNYNFP